MTSTTWRKALMTAGAALAASSLTVAGCSKHDGDTSDAGGADPGAVTRATDSAEAGAPSSGAGGGGGPIGTSSVVSTADTSPSPATAPDMSTYSGASTSPPPPDTQSSDPSSGSPGRATGPR